jgi:LuxR family transcriptional regulator, maltose regulon positive regulatory protein
MRTPESEEESHLTMPRSILYGKLNRPRSGVNPLARARLYEQVNTSLEGNVTTIVAPAGFGKTVLLASWMAQHPSPTAWLSLDANDNQLLTFVRYLALALEALFPNGCRETRSLVGGLFPPSLEQLTDCLLSEIGDLPESAVLILDDYQVIENPQIHALITNLIDHLARHLHLIIASRSEPLLPLSRWRLNGTLIEIRANDMRFDLGESRELLNLLLDVEVPVSVCTTLATRTEGWAAGLRLSALSLKDRSDLSVLAFDALGRSRYIRDYLMDEVFARQAPAIQELLLKSSLLDWMSDPLMAALTGAKADAPDAAPLAQLFEAGLFVELIDEREGIYRYHEFFRDFLRHRLAVQTTPQVIATLHREASCWLLGNGYFEEAVRHALASGDQLTAARMVEGQINVLLNRESKTRLEALLNLLPAQLIEERAPLLIARAWIAHFESRPRAIPPFLQQAEQLLQQVGSVPEEEAQAWRGDIAALQSQTLFWQSQDQAALDRATQALADIPPANHFARAIALTFAGLSQHTTGKTAAAKRFLRENLAQGTAASAAMNLRVLIALCIIQLDLQNREELQLTAESLLRQAEASDFLISKAWGHLFLGKASYDANDLEAAQFHFLAGAALRYIGNGTCIHECFVGLVLTYAALEQWERAAEMAATLVKFDSDPLSLERIGHAYSLQARLALMRGDVDTAQRWFHGSDAPLFPIIPFPVHEVSTVTRIRVLLTTEMPDGARQALVLAQQLQQEAAAINSTLRLIEALVLQALALDALKDDRQALSTLKEAIELAHPGRSTRLLIDFGPALGSLLQRLLKSGMITRRDVADYAAKLLEAFPLTADVSPVHQHAETDDQLVEPLTERETEVLELLALRLTDREIADTLVISPFTVRRHLDNISQKFGARGRRALVEHARRLDLIPPGAAH